MHLPWEETLIAICQAVEFDGSESGKFAGQALDLHAAARRDGNGNQGREGNQGSEIALDDSSTQSGRLFAALHRILYLHCFARHFTGVLPPPSPVYDPDFVPDNRLARELSSANRSRFCWSPGWEVCRIGEQCDLQVRNGDRYRTVKAGHYAFAAGPGMAPQVGDHVSLQVLAESFDVQPGIYFAFGETLGDQFDEVDSVRFYFHLDPAGAPRLVEQLTGCLNRFQIPFELKCQKYRENYDRVDAVVLYVARRYCDLVYRLMMDVAARVREHLRSAVPLFTKEIHEGIGLADDPGGTRSFGQDRCQLMVAAFRDVRRERKETRPDVDAFLSAVRSQFQRRGLSFERPYLSAGRVEMVNVSSISTEVAGSPPGQSPGRSEFIETADRIAHRLCRDAVWSGKACTWLEWTTSEGKQAGEPVFGTVGAELYAGTAGIALFLARMLRVRPSRYIEVVLRGAIEKSLAGLAAMPLSQPGFYDGAAGICFAAIEAGLQLDDERLTEHGLKQLARRMQSPLSAEALDVIDGRAGIIPLLLRVAARFDCAALLERAVQQGDELLELAEHSQAGCSWPTMPLHARRNATGFAHGAAGAATALLELHDRTGEPRFLTAAREAWRYERSWFCRELNNWPDFRFPKASGARGQGTAATESRKASNAKDHVAGDGFRYATAWCHGAVGIGLSRLRAWELGHRDTALAAEFESALTATRAWFDLHESAGGDYSLCHGIFGNAELLVEAARVLDRPDLRSVAAEIGRRGEQRFEQCGLPWPCGGTSVGETPNLMLGLAGIGLFYLRLDDPGQTESQLLLRPGRVDVAP